jgi:hypothetical protein
MVLRQSPTAVSPGLNRPGLDPAPTPEPNLHLVDGLWFASCPTCAFQLCQGRDQARVEWRARRLRCPVCHLDGAA